MSSREQYRALAEADEACAAAAELDNVRERCLRSAAAWHGMADRAERSDKLRAERDAEAIARKV